MNRLDIAGRGRFAIAEVPVTAEPCGEVLVNDARSGLTPAQMVEQKLVSLLRTTPLPVSQLHGARATRSLA
ncbi:MAG: hypothetical protein K2R98_08265 [Gemmataceae bacterium]|nr:hypothetical protein [Gemmataceae bacterium]